jgi:hypothetical protein
VIRPSVALVALLGGCFHPADFPPAVDLDTYDLKKPGITCMRRTRFDEERGCTALVGPGEAELRVRRRDEMGAGFALIRALIVLDGRLVYLWNEETEPAATGSKPVAVAVDPAPASVAAPSTPPEQPQGAPSAPETAGKAVRMETGRELPVLDIGVPPGEHVLQAFLRYRGRGYGVFSYLQGYRFDVRSTHTFAAAPGSLSEVTVEGYEKGGVTTPLEERPAVRWIGPAP